MPGHPLRARRAPDLHRVPAPGPGGHRPLRPGVGGPLDRRALDPALPEDAPAGYGPATGEGHQGEHRRAGRPVRAVHRGHRPQPLPGQDRLRAGQARRPAGAGPGQHRRAAVPPPGGETHRHRRRDGSAVAGPGHRDGRGPVRREREGTAGGVGRRGRRHVARAAAGRAGPLRPPDKPPEHQPRAHHGPPRSATRREHARWRCVC